MSPLACIKPLFLSENCLTMCVFWWWRQKEPSKLLWRLRVILQSASTSKTNLWQKLEAVCDKSAVTKTTKQPQKMAPKWRHFCLASNQAWPYKCVFSHKQKDSVFDKSTKYYAACSLRMEKWKNITCTALKTDSISSFSLESQMLSRNVRPSSGELNWKFWGIFGVFLVRRKGAN